MSFIFHDPFFDGFDDYLAQSLPRIHNDWFALPNESNETKESLTPKVRRDVITPFSGFGRMDLQENNKEYGIKVDIPGMAKEDIKISLDNNNLVIEGERKEEKEGESKDTKCHFSERHFGSFHREVSLPQNAKTEEINAMYENGVLYVTIPKKVETTCNKKQITVNYYVCFNT